MKTTWIPLITIFIAVSAAAGAEDGRKSFRFRGGDAAVGQESFVSVGCVQCHHVKGVKLAEPTKRRLDLVLAGEARFVKRYEDLLTAITNPRHVMTERYRALLSQSGGASDVEPFMPTLTKNMTAQQLIDLAAFLDERYKAELKGYGKD